MSPFLGFGLEAFAAAAFFAASASAAFLDVLHEETISVNANSNTLIECFKLIRFFGLVRENREYKTNLSFLLKKINIYLTKKLGNKNDVSL